jgi:hypothetical protein
MAKCEETGVTGGSILFGTKLNVDDDGERGLACMVVEHEFAGGGGVVPRPADGAAAEDILGRQPQEDLFDEDRLRQVVKDGDAPGIWHGWIVCLISESSYTPGVWWVCGGSPERLINRWKSEWFPFIFRAPRLPILIINAKTFRRLDVTG